MKLASWVIGLLIFSGNVFGAEPWSTWTTQLQGNPLSRRSAATSIGNLPSLDGAPNDILSLLHSAISRETFWQVEVIFARLLAMSGESDSGEQLSKSYKASDLQLEEMNEAILAAVVKHAPNSRKTFRLALELYTLSPDLALTDTRALDFVTHIAKVRPKAFLATVRKASPVQKLGAYSVFLELYPDQFDLIEVELAKALAHLPQNYLTSGERASEGIEKLLKQVPEPKRVKLASIVLQNLRSGMVFPDFLQMGPPERSTQPRLHPMSSLAWTVFLPTYQRDGVEYFQHQTRNEVGLLSTIAHLIGQNAALAETAQQCRRTLLIMAQGLPGLAWIRDRDSELLRVCSIATSGKIESEGARKERARVGQFQDQFMRLLEQWRSVERLTQLSQLIETKFGKPRITPWEQVERGIELLIDKLGLLSESGRSDAFDDIIQNAPIELQREFLASLAVRNTPLFAAMSAHAPCVREMLKSLTNSPDGTPE